VIIRPATADDVPALAGIVERAYSVYLERIGRRPGPMDDDYASRVSEAVVLVAEDGARGGVCGLIVLEPATDHLLIENVAVDPDHQHAGIGRALLARAEEFALGHGLDELRLYTNVAMTENQRLYRGLGYRETGRAIGEGFQRVYFAKALRPSLA
jgi:ribosomal protein S18 acetylase RimI-like enzyme